MEEQLGQGNARKPEFERLNALIAQFPFGVPLATKPDLVPFRGDRPTGRPLVKLPFGQVGNEFLATEKHPLGAINFPTIIGGRLFNPRDALRIIEENNFRDPDTGRLLQTFPDIDTAERFARDRSSNTRLVEVLKMMNGR